MKKIALALAVVMLFSCVYIGAFSLITNEKLRPPSILYIFEEITSLEYYSNVQDKLADIERLWNNGVSPSADSVGGGGRFDEDTPSWVIQFSYWLEQSTIGKVFLTIAGVVELVVYVIYDTVLTLIYVFKVFSVFLTGVPA